MTTFADTDDCVCHLLLGVVRGMTLDVVLGNALTETAEDLAHRLFAPRERRLRHSRGVVLRASTLAVLFDERVMDVLLAAAWLHDIGYARKARKTGFHPLDG